MTSARDEILARLRAQQRQEVHPPVWQSRLPADNLAGTFTKALTAVGGEVVRAAAVDEALDRLGELLKQLDARRVVANDATPLSGADLPARWPEVEWFMVGKTTGDLRAFCASADAGLSGAEAALASTGTIALHSGPGRSRLATLLPPVHIALVSADLLTPDLFTWIAGRQGELPSALTLVSGPSKTADIEQTLAVGVHGPKRFIVVLHG